jgi:DNA-binding NarL/FixJ family response regulator
MAGSVILLVDVPYDGPTALKLSWRHAYGLALVDYKMQGKDGVELHGHLRRVHADTVGVLVTAFDAAATVHAASRRHPPGPFQAGGVRPPDFALKEVPGTP